MESRPHFARAVAAFEPFPRNMDATVRSVIPRPSSDPLSSRPRLPSRLVVPSGSGGPTRLPARSARGDIVRVAADGGASPSGRAVGSRADRLFDDPFFDPVDDALTRPGGPSSAFADDPFFRAFRDVDASVDRLTRRLEEEAASPSTSTAPRAYRREERSERQLPGGGYSTSYYSESVVTFGAPPPTFADAARSPHLGASLWVVVAAGAVLGAYVKVARRFADGFERTRYRTVKKLQLVLMWPILWLANVDGFRGELRRAVDVGLGAGPRGDAPGPAGRGSRRRSDDGGEGGAGDTRGIAEDVRTKE